MASVDVLMSVEDFLKQHTELTIEDLKARGFVPGKHHVRVSDRGYEPVERSAALTDNPPGTPAGQFEGSAAIFTPVPEKGSANQR